MARTNSLANFLTDVANAIRTKKGTETTIAASAFDTEILNLPSGTYQTKNITISANGSQTITPDQGYDAIDEITITTQVPQKQLQTKSYNFTTNQTIELTPDTGYDGFDIVTLNINVDPNAVNYQIYTAAYIGQNNTIQRDETRYTTYKQIEIDLLPYINRTIIITNTGDRNFYGFTSVKPEDEVALNNPRQSTSGELTYKYTGGNDRYLVYDFTTSNQSDSVIRVELASVELIEKNITANGVYDAEDDNADGFSKVTINVPGQQINNQDKNITVNGTYTADSGYTGLGTVTVNVSEGIQEFASVSAMEQAGLEAGDKAVVYNSTNKLVGYYDTVNETGVIAVPANDIIYDDVNYTAEINHNNGYVIDETNLKNVMSEVASAYAWTGLFPTMYACSLFRMNDKWCIGVFSRNLTNGRVMYVAVNYDGIHPVYTGNTTTITGTLQYCEIDLTNFTYGDKKTIACTYIDYPGSSSTARAFVGPEIQTMPVNFSGNNQIKNLSYPAIYRGFSTTTNYNTYTKTGDTTVTDTITSQQLLDTGLMYGSSDANATANDIVAGKSGYVNGVKILGTRGGGTIRQYDSLEDLEEDTEIQDGELALVYKQWFRSFSELETTSYDGGKVKFLQEVVLPTEQTNTQSMQFIVGHYNYEFQVTTIGATLSYYNMSSGYVRTTVMTWTTSDAITYTADRSDLIIEDIEYLYAGTTNNCRYFCEVYDSYFTGVYKHTSSGNIIAPNQLTIDSANDLYNGEMGYGKNGIVTGDGSIMSRFSASELDSAFANNTAQKSPKQYLSGQFPSNTNRIGLQYFEFTNTPASELDAKYYLYQDIDSVGLPFSINDPSTRLSANWIKWINNYLYIGTYEQIYNSETTTYTNIKLHVLIYDNTLTLLNDYVVPVADYVGSSLRLSICNIDPINHTIMTTRRAYNSDYYAVVDWTMYIYDYTTGVQTKSLLINQSNDSANIYQIIRDPLTDYYYMVLHYDDNSSSWGPWGPHKVVRYDYATNTMTTLYAYSSSSSSSSEYSDQYQRYLLLSAPGYTILVNYGQVSYIQNGTTTEVNMGSLGGNFIDTNQNYNCAYINGDYLYLHLRNADGTPQSVGTYYRYLYRYNLTTHSSWEKVYQQSSSDYTTYAVGVETINNVLYYRIGVWVYLDPERWITTVHIGYGKRTDYDYNCNTNFATSILQQTIGNYFTTITCAGSSVSMRLFTNVKDFTADTNAIDYVQNGKLLPCYYYGGSYIPLGDITNEAFQNNKYLDTIIESSL